MNDETIRVDDAPFVDRPLVRRRDMLGRAVLWRSPVAFMPDDDREAGLAILLPSRLTLADAGAEIEGAP